MEVLGGRIVHVGDEAVRILGLDGVIDELEVTLDAPGAEEPRHRRLDFVPDGIAEKSRVAGQAPDALAYQPDHIGRPLAVDQISRIVLGAQPHHDVQSMALGGVQQCAGRHGVWDANGVEIVPRHLREVPLDDGEIVVLATLGIRPERPVGDAAHPQLLVADEEELATRPRTHRYPLQGARASSADAPVMVRQASATAPPATATSTATCTAIRKAVPAGMDAAVRAPSSMASTARTASPASAATATPAQLGRARKRANCRPAPCSSTTMRARTPPSRPPRISRSQRSKSPPATTGTPIECKADCTERTHSAGACQRPLHAVKRSGRRITSQARGRPGSG